MIADSDVGTPRWLAEEVVRSFLLDHDTLEPVVEQFVSETPYGDATALGAFLAHRGVLTRYQVSRLLEGQGRGLVMGPYTVVDAIGSGSLGTVYKALGKADGKAYALKVLPGRSPVNVRQARRYCQRFPTEAHPAVVPFLDVGSSQGLHYLVWPLVTGETLERRVNRLGALDATSVASLGVQIASALQFCAKHRIYHGLLKPSNVMLASGGVVRVLDFGIGLMLADGEEESLVDTMSTVNATSNMLDCAAPEVAIDPGKRSIAADQYSLGCTLYHALAGRGPFPDGNTVEKMLAHQSHEPPPLHELVRGVPAALESVIHRLLQKSPTARFRSADELHAALAPLARHAGPAQEPLPLPALVARPDSGTGSKPRMLRAAGVGGDQSGTYQSPSQTPLPASLASGRASGVWPVAPPSQASPAAASLRRAKQAENIPTVWERLWQSLMFWRTPADAVACTLLVPNGVLPGETISVQVIAHHQSLGQQASAMQDWKGSQPLPDAVPYGAELGLHVSIPGVMVREDAKRIVWKGRSEAVSFTMTVPRDWPSGKRALGTLTLGLGQLPVAALAFEVVIVTSSFVAVRR